MRLYPRHGTASANTDSRVVPVLLNSIPPREQLKAAFEELDLRCRHRRRCEGKHEICISEGVNAPASFGKIYFSCLVKGNMSIKYLAPPHPQMTVAQRATMVHALKRMSPPPVLGKEARAYMTKILSSLLPRGYKRKNAKALQSASGEEENDEYGVDAESEEIIEYDTDEQVCDEGSSEASAGEAGSFPLRNNAYTPPSDRFATFVDQFRFRPGNNDSASGRASSSNGKERTRATKNNTLAPHIENAKAGPSREVEVVYMSDGGDSYWWSSAQVKRQRDEDSAVEPRTRTAKERRI